MGPTGFEPLTPRLNSPRSPWRACAAAAYGGARGTAPAAAVTVKFKLGIVVLRLTDQSAAAAIKAVSDLAAHTDPDGLAGAVTVLQRGLLRIRHP
jgi:hypothetical protein